MEPILTAALKYGPWCLMSFYLVREAFKSRNAVPANSQAGETIEKPGGGETHSRLSVRLEKLEAAAERMANAMERSADSADRMEDLLRDCVAGHAHTQAAVAELKGQMSGLSPRMRN